jgi:hypothetical protein
MIADTMRSALSPYVDRGIVPGLVALVSRRGEVRVEVLGSKTDGAADPMRRDTIFRVTSMTKPVTAAAAMILVETPDARPSSAPRTSSAWARSVPLCPPNRLLRTSGCAASRRCRSCINRGSHPSVGQKEARPCMEKGRRRTIRLTTPAARGLALHVSRPRELAPLGQATLLTPNILSVWSRLLGGLLYAASPQIG